jgi:hypothetical protein
MNEKYTQIHPDALSAVMEELSRRQTPLEVELREIAARIQPDKQLPRMHEIRELLERAADAVADDRALLSSLADRLNQHLGRG